ncbi:MAP kinase kinase kinase wis4 [Stylophora pistillata]|uniref:MAP kinase kinase kinase wis4 n=1 Tax=Stylophora pistillata TaxID=50429 RepID=A0A2B4RES6_STYPI|nr:MAP kinase kinase kinase wis4 [Stylophora pistillata]
MPFQALSEAFKKDKQKRAKLCRIYEETNGFLDQLNEHTAVKVLEESVDDFKTTLEDNMKNIKPRDQYIVLLAGETSAGKSSIINLILGEDLLPYKTLCSTSTICELKYGEKPAIRAHFENEEKNPPICREFGDPSQNFKEEIAEFTSSRTQDGRERAPCKKEGVMIVDSPGVGESQAMDECVHSYLENAFCFMYVIKSSNAGGVQEDRLLSLLQKVKAHKGNERMDDRLFTKSALFVSNFWDTIPPEEVDEVKNSQLEALTRKMGELDESQIIYMSCKRVQLAQSYGLITGEFHQLINGISSLLKSYMNDSLQIYYKWLDDFLFCASEKVRIALNLTTLSRNGIEKKMQKVMARMAELEKSQDQLFNELSEYQAEVIKKVINNLAAYFKSEETTRRFCTWSLSDLPEAKATWEETESEALRCISERARTFVQKWEEDEGHFARTQGTLIKYCSVKYDIMEEEIRYLQVEAGRPEQGNPSCEPPKRHTSRRRFPRIHSGLQGSTPMWFRQGLTSVVLDTPFIYNFPEKLKRNFQHKKKLETFKRAPDAYMQMESMKCLGLIANEESLLPFINDQLKDAVQFLKNIKAKISRLREGDKLLYSKLREANSRSTLQIKEVYEPIRSRLEVLKREVTVFEVNSLRTSDFSSKELQWNQDDKSIVGRGSFATVYSGVLLRQGQPKVEVALKVYNNPLRSSNISHFIGEEYSLRYLNHPNIIKFFGTHLHQSSPSWTKVMIVLELCKCSLNTRIMSKPENAPAHCKDETARVNVLLWAEQILDALNYIHDQGFVHRDLKLDNLLAVDLGMLPCSNFDSSSPVFGERKRLTVFAAKESLSSLLPHDLQ